MPWRSANKEWRKYWNLNQKPTRLYVTSIKALSPIAISRIKYNRLFNAIHSIAANNGKTAATEFISIDTFPFSFEENNDKIPITTCIQFNW